MSTREKNFIFIAISLAMLGIFLTPSKTFAYEPATTHAALTDEAVDFFNKYYGEKISAAEKELIISGAVAEDTIPRYINHFYDPIYNAAWSGSYTYLGYILNPLTSKNWSQNPLWQSAFGYFYLGNTLSEFTEPLGEVTSNKAWQRAIYSYVNGNKAEAFVALGHILHLIEDVTVPEHTRDDVHLLWSGTESPYERWTNQFTRENFGVVDELMRKRLTPITKNSLDEYFNEIALYSNKRFFSQDTIWEEKYQNPNKEDIVFNQRELDDEGGFSVFYYFYDEDRNPYKLYKQILGLEWRNVIEFGPETLDDDFILQDYWSRLSRKAILSGAGVIDLFFREVARAEKDPNFRASIDSQNMITLADALNIKVSSALAAGVNYVTQKISQALTIVTSSFSAYFGFSPPGSTTSSTPPPTAATTSSSAFKEKTPTAQAAKNFEETQGTIPNTPETLPSLSSNDSKGESANNFALAALSGAVAGTSTATTTETEGPSGAAFNPDSGAGGPSADEAKCIGKTNQTYQKILISEVQFETPSGTKDEFVELWNPNDFPVDLSCWALKRKSAKSSPDSDTSGELLLVSKSAFGGSIPARGFFLVAHPDGYQGTVAADLRYSSASYSIANNNAVLLYNPKDERVDTLGFGTDQLKIKDYEALPFVFSAPSSSDPFSISRILPNDTDVNASDFKLTRPNPENKMSTSRNIDTLPSFFDVFDDIPAPTTTPTSTPPDSGDSSTACVPLDHSSDNTSGTQNGKIVISEIQIESTASTSDEFVELYNPNSFPVNLNGWKLSRKTSGGREEILIPSSAFVGVIPAYSFWLIADIEGYTNCSVRPDLVWAKSHSIAKDNTILLYDADGVLIDKAGYGEAVDFESESFAINPQDGQSIERKARSISTVESMASGGDSNYGNSFDSDNNANDFILRSVSDPQNSLMQEIPMLSLSTLYVGPDNGNKLIHFTWTDTTTALPSAVTYRIYIGKAVFFENPDDAIQYYLDHRDLTGDVKYELEQVDQTWSQDFEYPAVRFNGEERTTEFDFCAFPVSSSAFQAIATLEDSEGKVLAASNLSGHFKMERDFNCAPPRVVDLRIGESTTTIVLYWTARTNFEDVRAAETVEALENDWDNQLLLASRRGVPYFTGLVGGPQYCEVGIYCALSIDKTKLQDNTTYYFGVRGLTIRVSNCSGCVYVSKLSNTVSLLNQHPPRPENT